MNINHISVSRKKTFDLCQQKYKYQYHLKLESPVSEPFYFIYGTIVHKIAELYVENKGQIPIGELAQDVVRGKIEIEDGKICPPLPDDYKKKFQKHLRAIQNLNDRIGWDGLVEWNFHYDLDPPHNRYVTGFIDRLIIKGDGDAKRAFIIDYKTTKKGKWRVNTETVKDDLQLRMYARVVSREFGIKAEHIKAALYYLEGENLIAACYDEESLQNVENDLRSAYIRIRNTDSDKVFGTVSWQCKQCEYATLCPFYKGWQNSGNESVWDGSMDNLGHSGWGD